MRYLVINKKTKIVDNIIEWDGIAKIPHLDIFQLEQGEGGPGWQWDGSKAIDPTPPPEVPVPRAKAQIKKL